jgi:hypothetical protein
MADRGVEKGFGVFRPVLLNNEEAKREYRAVLATLKPIARAWTSKATEPEGVQTFGNFFQGYHEGMTGEPAPDWYSTISGVGTSVLVTPWVFGRLLKGIWSGAKLTGVPQRMAARQLPAWKAMKSLAKAEAGARTDKAREIGKSLSNKEIRRLAKELSARTGRNITEAAVKLRLTQIIKGGITSRPELAAKANPIIEEFINASTELKALGILPEYTYISKLPRKEIAELLRRKRSLEMQLNRLRNPAQKQTLARMIEALRVREAPTIGRRLRQVAEKLDKTSPDLSERLAKALVGTELSGDKLLAQLVKIEKASAGERASIITRLEKVATKPSLSKSDTNLLATGIKQLQNKSPDISERLAKVLEIKTADEASLTAALAKISSLEVEKIAAISREIQQLAGRVETQKIAGLSPLLRKLVSLKFQFAGKQAKINELEAKIGDIARSVRQSYKEGGTKYFPRMYLSKEEEAAARKVSLYAQQRIRAKYALERKPIPADVRKAMGEIAQPQYPVVKRLIQEAWDIETGKLFDFAARNPAWVGKEWRAGLARKALPDTKGYGSLRGLYVQPKIYDDVTGLVATKSDIGAIYDSFIGYWKLGKTVFNPATHFRNMWSNSILLDLSGMDHAAQVKYAAKALEHYRRNTVEYQTASKYFARTGLAKGELLDEMLRSLREQPGKGIARHINATNRFAGKVAEKPSQVYQAEEMAAKLMKYLEGRDKGMTVEQAVAEAHKWLFDYTDLSQWEKQIARRVIPFYTFPRKALPRVLEAAATRPYVVAKYPLIAKATTQYSLYTLDITDADWTHIQQDLPEYMRNGSYILMPYRDKNGDLRFFDWTYVVPWGELYEAHERGLLKVGITNPILQVWADLRTNKSGWTGRQIYDDDIPAEKQTDAYRREQTYKKMLYVWQALVPSLAYKGIYWDKLYGAATGKKVRGKDMLLPEAIAHTLFGLRTQSIDPDEQRRWSLLRMQEGFDELRGNMLRLLIQRNNEDITEEQFDKKWDVYLEQMHSFHTDAIIDEDNAPSIEELLRTMNDLSEVPVGYEEEKE